LPRLIKRILEATSPGAGGVSSGIDFVGDIAIVRLQGLDTKTRVEVAESLLKELRNVRSVFEQEGGIEGEYRLRTLRYLAGENRTKTVHKENGFFYELDVATCYFSPRLSTERMRVAKAVAPGERVLNMFAGVGPFSIPIAKKAAVTSCELNREAFDYHQRNNKKNKVQQSIKMLNVDAKELPELLEERYDRVLMPHPSMSDKFVDAAVRLAKPGGTVYYYRHVSAEDEGEAAKAVADELGGKLPKTCGFTTRLVREVGPRFIEMVAEVRVGG